MFEVKFANKTVNTRFYVERKINIGNVKPEEIADVINRNPALLPDTMCLFGERRYVYAHREGDSVVVEVLYIRNKPFNPMMPIGMLQNYARVAEEEIACKVDDMILAYRDIASMVVVRKHYAV